MSKIIENLCDLADKVPADYAGKLSVHTDKISDRKQLLAWAKILTDIRINHGTYNNCWIVGDTGDIRVFVDYEPGLLGEAPREPEPPKMKSEDASKKVLDALLAGDLVS